MNRITLNEIRLGDPLPSDCHDANGRLLLKKGAIITSERQLEGLIQHGMYRKEGGTGRPGTVTPANSTVEKPSVFTRLAVVETRLTKLFNGVLNKREEPGFPNQILNLAREIQSICAVDADAVLGALHLNVNTKYTVLHPIDVAVLSELIGIRRGIPQPERVSLLAAALTANIGILELQDVLYNQAGLITAAQREEIRLHPVIGVDLLLELGIEDDAWFSAVLHHHEKIDGSGYPGTLKGDFIPLSARILSLADTYSAMVTPRAFREAVSSKDALRELFLKRGSEVDADLAALFIKELGCYPPGAFVKLANGDVGIVIKRGKEGTRPIVKCIIGPRGAPLPFPVVRDTHQKEYEIRSVVPRDETLSIDVRYLWT